MVTRSIGITGVALSRDYSEAVHMHLYAFRDFHLACRTWMIFKTARVLPQASNFLPSRAFEVRRARSAQAKAQDPLLACLTTKLYQSTYDKLLAITRISTWSEWTYEHRI
jgi:hypothetical protein